MMCVVDICSNKLVVRAICMNCMKKCPKEAFRIPLPE